ncbi:ABC transporter ATP-binding protein [Anaerobacillus sp. CMMVII]|uniref:ABC transporter ATP-binding protein n=1 Tax=Anaerobacillus sp. CMMVII TaxID=2755588 RepID=UPI0021B7B95A|nr:ABC transporter ATP-binding protein [Anaerobacillus sp. CMMVII]MCT8139278.1 ABC transporter ATP-binding protein [Anaerobacillus sp. CMMVII]
MDNQVLLKIENVSKVYADNQVVSPFDFSMNKPEVIALCGGNGAGKSTIIKMVTGQTRATTGKITINGVDWHKNRMAYAKQIGYMPDDFHLQQPLSVIEFISFFASLKKADKHVTETLAKVGLLEKKDQLISKLSKGMRQRLLLAQALVSKPKLILLDEPTNGLDPQWVKTFIEILLDLKKNGQGILFSTHNLAVAEEVADQVIFLKNGIIKERIHFEENVPRDLSQYYKEVFA